MPVHNGKLATRFERCAHGAGQTRPIRYAVKGIRHEHEIHGAGDKRFQLISVARDEVAVCYSAFG